MANFSGWGKRKKFLLSIVAFMSYSFDLTGIIEIKDIEGKIL
jgi:hypothetical protein